MEIAKLIEDKNIKLTNARRVILNILLNATKPLSYEDIKLDISMDKATFYRNISKFEDEHIVNSFESNDKKRYFEISKNKHAHFICSLCNGVECINKPCDFELDGYIVENVIIKGICNKCK
ncbi:MAG: transcriptional repressor [Campylobacterota bacterium]|nr:transcriptional repressor [Campylobacterota bacterium]